MPADTSIMRYLRPAETWTEALPVGNGRLGGMVYAAPMEDVVDLNEETLWGATKENPNNPRAAGALERVRSLIFAGDLKGAEAVVLEDMLGEPAHFPPYEPLGTLSVKLIKPVDYRDYVRELDLASAIASARFSLDGVAHRREYFSSVADDVIVIRHVAEGGDLPTMKLALRRDADAKLHGAGSPPPMPGQGGDMVSVIGTAADSDPREHILLMTGSVDGGAVDFVAGVSVVLPGAGKLLSHHWDDRGPSHVYTMGGQELTLLVAAETTFRGGDAKAAEERVIQRLLAAEDKGFERLRADHVAASTELHERFSLRLRRADDVQDAPTVVPELLGHIRRGEGDTRLLVELFVNYCRYLLASSSRPGSLPANLQGIWNAERWPTWESDFHPNINLQVNYWPADPMGLPESVEPLADWLDTARRNGEVTARETYRSGGWAMNHISNAWGFTAPGAGVFGIWPLGGAWMTLSLYDHYLFTMDADFLRDRVYPLMRGAAKFFLDFLVEAPEGGPAAGHLVTVPSNSPENSFLDRDGVEAFLTYGATMDTMIVSHLLSATIEALQVLRRREPDLDPGFDDRLAATRDRLLPVRISPTTGGIQEWAEDYEEVDPGHRHVSPLYDVFPGRRISHATTPELAAAAAHTIARKFASGYEEEGWSLGWIATILARLNDGDGALDCVDRLLRHLLFQNLFVEAHMYPQVGDMQGVPSAVLEMLAHSDLDQVILLPALPSAWSDGEVQGLRLRGNRELTMSWQDGRLLRAEIRHAGAGTRPDVRVHAPGEYTVTETDAATIVTR